MPRTTRTDQASYASGAGGPYADPSGSVIGSGLPTINSALSGPWMIETQSLDFDYIRVPMGQVSSMNLMLSGASYAGQIFHTYLQVKVTARYQRKKSYDFYDTSGWTQTQKFDVLVTSADANGVTYGTIPSGTASALGPAGSVRTVQEYSRRNLWANEVEPTEISRSIDDVYNVRFAEMDSYIDGKLTMRYSPTADYFGRFQNTFVSPWVNGGLGVGASVDSRGSFCGPLPMVDILWGAYSINQEQKSQVWGTIDQVGQLVTDKKLADDISPTVVVQGSYAPDIGIEHYSINRHDYYNT